MLVINVKKKTKLLVASNANNFQLITCQFGCNSKCNVNFFLNVAFFLNSEISSRELYLVDNRRVLTFIFDSLQRLKQKRCLNKKTRPSPNLKLSLVHFIDLLGNRFLVAFMHLKCYLFIRQGLTTTRLV